MSKADEDWCHLVLRVRYRVNDTDKEFNNPRLLLSTLLKIIPSTIWLSDMGEKYCRDGRLTLKIDAKIEEFHDWPQVSKIAQPNAQSEGRGSDASATRKASK